MIQTQEGDCYMPEAVSFEVNEVLELKGWFFKIVLVDAFTNKICLKRISDKEAGKKSDI